MPLPRLYVIGDSISIHYGPYLQRFLEGVCAYARKAGEQEALLNLDNPAGANGGDSGKVLQFLNAMAARGGLAADMMLVNCGLHDIKVDTSTGLRQVPLDAYRSNLLAIVATIRGMGIEAVWIRTTPVDDQTHNSRVKEFHRFKADLVNYNTAADAIMGQLKVPSIDLHGFTQSIGPEPFCDHVHFHERIRELQAAFIAGWVRSRLGM